MGYLELDTEAGNCLELGCNPVCTLHDIPNYIVGYTSDYSFLGGIPSYMYLLCKPDYRSCRYILDYIHLRRRSAHSVLPCMSEYIGHRHCCNCACTFLLCIPAHNFPGCKSAHNLLHCILDYIPLGNCCKSACSVARCRSVCTDCPEDSCS